MAVQYALISENGEIQHVVSMGADSDYVDGQLYNGLLAKAVASDADGHELIATKYYVDGQWHSREPRLNAWQDWIDNAWSVNLDRLMQQVRHDRDQGLYTCDWTQFADSPLTATEKAEWATYRQALRDVPETYAAATSLDDIIWPTKPE